MVGAWSEHAETFLIVAGLLGAVGFSIPLFFAPLAWARAFRWRLPVDTDLTVYFGRGLGAVALVLSALQLKAGFHGTDLEIAFKFTIAAAALLTLMHIWGAVRRIQPITETIEIGFWAAIVVLGLLFYPA